jgi:hypothetical protein
MSKEMQTFQGLIVTSEWEDKDLTQISILTFDEDELIIILNKNGKELLNHIRAEVTIDGEVIQKDDKKYLKVSKFIIIDTG